MISYTTRPFLQIEHIQFDRLTYDVKYKIILNYDQCKVEMYSMIHCIHCMMYMMCKCPGKKERAGGRKDEEVKLKKKFYFDSRN